MWTGRSSGSLPTPTPGSCTGATLSPVVIIPPAMHKSPGRVGAGHYSHNPLPTLQPPSKVRWGDYLSAAILLRRGSSQPGWHSQWASMKTNTSPVALAAPSIRAPAGPSLLLLLSSFTPSSLATFSLRADLSCPGISRAVVSGQSGKCHRGATGRLGVAITLPGHLFVCLSCGPL